MKVEFLTLTDGRNGSVAILHFRKGAEAADLFQVTMRNVYTDADIGKRFHIHGRVQTRTGDVCGGGNLTLIPSRAASSDPQHFWVSAHFPHPGMYEVVVTLRDVSVPDGEILWTDTLPFQVRDQPPTP